MIDLRPTDEQQQMLYGAISLLADHSPVSRLRASQPAVDVHPRLVEFGWYGVGLPAASGGLELGVVEEALLYIEAGRFLLSPAVLATTLAARVADDEARRAFLDGRRRAALLLPDPETGAVWCLDRGDASHLLVFGLDRIELAPVDAFSGDRVESFDEAVLIEKGQLAGTRSGGSEPSDRAILLTAAMLAGIAGACRDLAVDYAKIREQFGQPIGSFQAIKHLCSDMGMHAYAAEAQVKLAAVAAAEDPAGAPFQIAAAAATAMAAARDNASVAIQVHGGIGFTAECDVHFHLKRAHLLGRLLGGLGHQRRALLAMPAPQRI